MEIDLDAVLVQLKEIVEWLEANEMEETLYAQAELAVLTERIAALHLRVVP